MFHHYLRYPTLSCCHLSNDVFLTNGFSHALLACCKTSWRVGGCMAGGQNCCCALKSFQLDLNSPHWMNGGKPPPNYLDNTFCAFPFLVIIYQSSWLLIQQSSPIAHFAIQSISIQLLALFRAKIHYNNVRDRRPDHLHSFLINNN